MGLINFKMKEIAEIFPFGSIESGYVLHWFGLTDSYFWLNLAGHELFKYLTLLGNLANSSLPYVDYQLARFIEDLCHIIPSIATPIPDGDNEAVFDRFYQPATGWLWDRRLDTGYLKNGPDIWFFRHGSRVIVRWDCQKEANWWTETKGESVIEYSDLLNELREFFRAFWIRMDQQVREASTNWPFPKVRIDIQRLRKEHEERKQTIDTLLKDLSQLNIH